MKLLIPENILIKFYDKYLLLMNFPSDIITNDYKVSIIKNIFNSPTSTYDGYTNILYTKLNILNNHYLRLFKLNRILTYTKI